MFKNAKGNSHQNHHQKVSITIVCNLKYFSNASIWQGKESAISEKTWSIKERGRDHKIINVSTATKALFVARLESYPSVPSTFRFSFVKNLCICNEQYFPFTTQQFESFSVPKMNRIWGFHFISFDFISFLLISFLCRCPAASHGSVPG